MAKPCRRGEECPKRREQDVQRPGNEEVHCILRNNFRVAGAQGREVAVKNESGEASRVRSQGHSQSLEFIPRVLIRKSCHRPHGRISRTIVMLSKRSQSPKDKHCMIPLT